MTDHAYWLGFSLVPEIGIKRLNLLRHAFGSLQEAWFAKENDLRAAGLENQPLNNLIKWRKKLDLEAELVRVKQVGASLITLDDADYPPLLKTLPDAPPIFYTKGEISPQDHRALSIVGTRRATRYGLDCAKHLAYELAKSGVTIVSGLAHGIDAAAHKGALEAGGRTIAILGNGIEQVYPRDHRDLAARVASSGALLTEFPIGAQPEARHFPRRNRVISGISLGVLIVEAPEKSGALITASIAADQGREVFAVPGNIFSASSVGTNKLIQDGAKLVNDVSDILNELQLVREIIQTRTITEEVAPTSDIEKAILQHLSAEPIHIDEIVRISSMPISNVSGILTILELKGLVRMVGHMQYSLELRH